MARTYAILGGPLCAALFGTAFCLWTALGNEVNICVTTGCTLYQDFTIAGISLWWIGGAAFISVALASILGSLGIARWLAGLFLFCDIGFLILMSLTAPCINCLVAAAFFALCYFLIRRCAQTSSAPSQTESSRRSWLLLIWGIFFVINLGFAARSQIALWPLLNESGDPKISLFFSPSCPYCIDGVNALSGNIDAAFYPVAENEEDVFKIAKMKDLIAEGMSMAEALGQSMEVAQGSFWSGLSPDMLLLKFNLLCNKAHIYGAGSQGVPFLEFKGLPGSLLSAARSDNVQASENNLYKAGEFSSSDYRLPSELDTLSQCGGAKPCPPDHAAEPR